MDTITIGTGGANFHNDVGTAALLIVNATAATFANGYEVSQKPIPLPTLTTLGVAQRSGHGERVSLHAFRTPAPRPVC